jgi:hypothetical protein
MPLDLTPIRPTPLPQPHSDPDRWSDEELTLHREQAAGLVGWLFLWQHEQTHLQEIIGRIDATISVRRQRENHARRKRNA